MNSKYYSGTIQNYLNELSSKASTPGGGSAAALTACLGIALNLMVINFSIKEGIKNAENDVFILLKTKQEEQLKRMELLIDKDCEVFDSLMKNLNSKEGSENRYKEAAGVPMDICRTCNESIEASSFLLENGNKNLITDVGCAVDLIRSAFFAAALNVKVNLKYIKDGEYIGKARKELEDMHLKIEGVSNEVLSEINKLVT